MIGVCSVTFCFSFLFPSGPFFDIRKLVPDKMVSRLLVGDNNLSKFWPAYQFARPNLKHSSLVTATDLDGLDHALSQVDERDQVIVSVLTSILMEEVSQVDVESSAFNICEQAVSRIIGLCPRSPSCQVYFVFMFSLLSSFNLLFLLYFIYFSVLRFSIRLIFDP